jgi:MinD superfamily P-loop ATPase
MRQIVVASGKGGTGKTSVTASLAFVMPPHVLADCDVDAADLHLLAGPDFAATHDFVSGELAVVDPEACTGCGLCREKCRFDALTPTFEVIEEHCEGCGMCAFVCPAGAVAMEPRHCGWWYESATRFGPMVHAALKTGQENSGRLVTLVRNRAAETAAELGLDLVLVDGSPGIGCPVIASLTGTDLVLLVAEPTVSAVHDLERVRQLAAHFKIPAACLVNKADVNPETTEALRSWCVEKNVSLVGELPYDAAFTKAQLAGLSLPEYDPQPWQPLFASIRDKLTAALAVEDAPPPE